MLTNTQKEIFSDDVQVLMEAGFLTSDGKITKDLEYYIRHLNFVALKTKILARAKEIVKEKDCGDCGDCD